MVKCGEVVAAMVNEKSAIPACVYPLARLKPRCSKAQAACRLLKSLRNCFGLTFRNLVFECLIQGLVRRKIRTRIQKIHTLCR
jgi:hypothetical protein